MDGDDIGVRQGGGCFSLADKTLGLCAARDGLSFENFQRRAISRFRLAGEVDLCRTPFADYLSNLEGAN